MPNPYLASSLPDHQVAELHRLMTEEIKEIAVFFMNPQGVITGGNWRRRKDGSVFWGRIALTALRDQAGELVGFSKITVDLTDHKMLERCENEKEETRRASRNWGMPLTG